MNKALIISAAPEENIEYIKELYSALESPVVICADGGYDKARALDIPVKLLVGDMDSITSFQKVDVKKLPTKKDFSDTEACAFAAAEMGCSQVFLTGATGGRMDHMLCNLFLLELMEEIKVKGYVVDCKNVVQLAKNGSYSLPSGFKYFSLAPLDSKVTGIYIRKAKYPLSNASTRRGSTLTLSNEPVEDSFEIEIGSGRALLIFSKD